MTSPNSSGTGSTAAARASRRPAPPGGNTPKERAESAVAFVRRYRWLILLGLITAAIMEVLDTTIINAHNAALQALNAQVMQQSSMLSFNDAWIFVLTVFVLISPAILLLRRPAHPPAMPADG